MYTHFRITEEDNQRRKVLHLSWRDIVQAGLKACEDKKKPSPLEFPLREALKNLAIIINIIKNPEGRTP
jgi:hypothetical protein